MTNPLLLRETNPDLPTTNSQLWAALEGVSSFSCRLVGAKLSDEDPPLYGTRDGQLVFSPSRVFAVSIQRRRASSLGVNPELSAPWGIASLVPENGRHLQTTDEILNAVQRLARDHPDKPVAVYDPVVRILRPVYVNVTGMDHSPWLNVRLPDAIVIGLQQAFGRALQDRLTSPQID
jgi:hypothetical protein